MGRLFWLMFPIIVTTVAGIFFVVVLAADMADLKSTPIVVAIGAAVGVFVTYIVAKMINDQRRKSA